MMATRGSWSLGVKLYCSCLVLASLAFAGPVEAKATLTILPAGTLVYAINDSGTVAGVDGTGLGFLRAPDGTITTFSAGSGLQNTTARSINESGVIAGYDLDNSHMMHGFVRGADGTVTTFDAPEAGGASGQGTLALSINAQGVVTGYYFDQAGVRHGFLRATDGTITRIDVPHAPETVAESVNDKGEIAGRWEDTVSHGFVRSVKGKITSFDVPGDTLATFVGGISSKGTIAGLYLDQMDGAHGYIRQRSGAFSTFDLDSGQIDGVLAFNAKGEITGVNKVNEQGRTQGFVRYPNGTVKAIKPPGANNGVAPYGINKDGIVAGYFLSRPDHHTSDTSYGFIWTP